MKKIRTFCFSRLVNGEHFQLHWDFVDFLKSLIVEFIMLEVVWEKYFSKFNIERKAYKVHHEDFETSFIQKANKQRDVIVRKVKLMIKLARLSSNPEEQYSASVAHLLLKKDKYVFRMPYLEKTALITSIVENCRDEKYVTHISRIGLTAIINELADANLLFDEIYSTRSMSRNAIRMLDSMVTIRRGVDTSFKDLAEAINALYTLNELGEKNPQTRELLSTIIDGINAYIDQAELVYNRRTGGKK